MSRQIKNMIEGRATIVNIDQTRKKIEDMGAIFKSNYIFNDIIFVPEKTKYNLSDDFLRARTYIKNDWPTKKVVLVRKQTKFQKTGKIDNIILKKEFNSEEEATNFIRKEFGEYERSFEYEREGWQYQYSKHRIFIEDIKKFKPSIEIEADSENDIESLFAKIGIVEKIHSSMPEIMRNILKS